MQEFLGFLKAIGLGENWLAVAGLWYIAWNLRPLKNAPQILKDSVKELKSLADSVIEALNTHAEILKSVNTKLEKHHSIKVELEDD